MPETDRRALSEHNNPSESVEGASHASKKHKSDYHTSILTFGLSHSPVQVQVLSNQTVFSLVDIICRETTVGMDEDVYEHMWDVLDPYRGVAYNSSDDYVNQQYDFECPTFKASQTKLSDLHLGLNSAVTLKYDYGSTSYYSIQLLAETPYDQESCSETFPRRKPEEAAAALVEFSTDQVNLNEMFPTFNKWITEGRMLKLHFFQAGRKHNHGLQERGNGGVRHMMFMPEKAGMSDLADYLHSFNYASQFEYKKWRDGYPEYTWYSMVIFPPYGTVEKYIKFKADQEVGFCEAKMAPPCEGLMQLNSIFPKLAALAGYKKDAKVKKGWMTYKDNVLRICSGDTAPQPKGCKPPKFTAFIGLDQHEPASDESIVAAVQVEIKSLHHLFCVAEGLLMSSAE